MRCSHRHMIHRLDSFLPHGHADNRTSPHQSQRLGQKANKMTWVATRSMVDCVVLLWRFPAMIKPPWLYLPPTVSLYRLMTPYHAKHNVLCRPEQHIKRELFCTIIVVHLVIVPIIIVSKQSLPIVRIYESIA